MTRSINLKSRGTEYTRSYSYMPGVELGSGRTSGGRLAYSKNMYRDYDGEGSELIESIPGYRRIANLGAKIHGIYVQKISDGEDALIIHAGTHLYRMRLSDRDTVGETSPIADVANAKRAVFPIGKTLCFIDEGRIVEILDDGTVQYIPRNSEKVYTPTLYLGGEVFEDRNILCDRGRERYLIESFKKYSYGTRSLNYKILDHELKTCAVSGIDWYYTGPVYIPAEVELGGEIYSVIRVLDYALHMSTNITELYIAEGVEDVGTYSFNGCYALQKVVMPRSLKRIGPAAFQFCKALTEVYIGKSTDLIEAGAFNGCTSLASVSFGGSRDLFQEISGIENITVNVEYNVEPRDTAIRIPIHSDADLAVSLTENGVEKEFFEERDEAGRLVAVGYISQLARDEGVDVSVLLNTKEQKSSFGTGDIFGDEVLFGCTVAEVFDGRVFISGNPSLPNTVFHSHALDNIYDEGLYFPGHGYITAGVGGYTVKSMLAVGDSLAVFKSGDDGSGSIFYYTPTATDDDTTPRAYKQSYAHNGIGTVGPALSFMDDPVFVTRSGISALTRKSINYDRSVACRSHNVNHSLLREPLESTILTEWCGYLVVGTPGRIYLADSRATFTHKTGDVEYEWFLLDDIGSYENSTRVYRYDSYEIDDCHVHPDEGEVAVGEAMSYVRDDGRCVFYVTQGGVRYTVYPSGEMTGGSFSPAVAYLGVGKLLFFGTESGALLVFNNDKRGIAPDRLRLAPDFAAEEYAARHSRSIHPDFYGFDGHAAEYAIKTAYDDCDIPHLTKSTVKHSLVIKCRSFSRGDMTLEVGRGEEGYREIARLSDSEFSFDEVDFECFSLNTAPYYTIPVAEKEKGWIEKQIAIYSGRYLSPIGIYSITYRYTVKGRIKKS